MKPSDLITIARNQSWATIDVVTAAQSYQYLNIVLEDFWKDITDNNIWLWINTWTYNLTANTATYTLATATPAATLLLSTFWIEQLYKIWVKYNSWDTYYTPVSLIYPEWQLKQPDYYAASQNKAVPTATQNDNTITLYPTPTTTVTNWLQIIWPKKHFDLSSSTEDVEWCILIPAQWHYVLIEGLKYWFYGNMWVNFDDRKYQTKQFYEAEKLRCINQMMDKLQESSQLFIPDLTYRS